LIDQTSVKKEIASIFKTIFTVMFALFFAVVLAIHLIVSERTAPYQLLVSYANDIAEGDFSKNIPVKDMERPDEMGEISQSFQRIISTFRDENILLEEKVEKINQVLEKQYSYILETEKAASLGNLVAGVSHEINTPLGVGISTGSHIEAITSASIDKMSSGEMSKEDLIKFFETLTEATAILNNNLNRAAKLVKSFKNIAVDQGSEIKEAFKLEQVIGDVITSLRNEYKRQKHEIQYHCSPEIIINSYPGLFAQLFTNLLMNAIQHGFRDKVEGIIKIDCWLDGSLLFIIFEDNGCGISEENQKKIFELFRSVNPNSEGKGIGLFVTKSQVESKGGKIELESEYGVGTTFRIYLKNLC